MYLHTQVHIYRCSLFDQFSKPRQECSTSFPPLFDQFSNSASFLLRPVFLFDQFYPSRWSCTVTFCVFGFTHARKCNVPGPRRTALGSGQVLYMPEPHEVSVLYMQYTFCSFQLDLNFLFYYSFVHILLWYRRRT